MKIIELASGTALILAVLCGLSCSSYDCRSSNASKDLLRQVPVPASHTPDPSPPGAGGGETVRKQTYTIDPDNGDFTFHRSVERAVGRLGAELAALDRQTAEWLGAEPFGGVLVRRADPKGPAASAGLKSDDVITALGGSPVLSIDRLEYLIEESKPGDRVELGVLRGKEKIKVEVELGAEKRIEGGKGFQQRLPLLDDRNRTGLVLAELTDEARPIVLGPGAAEKGLLVVDVLPGGPAYFAGVLVRDYLTRAGDRALGGISDYSAVVGALEPGDEAAFTLRRNGAGTQVSVEIDENASAESGFWLPAVVKYEWKPAHRRLWFLMGFLFNHESCYSVRARNGAPESYSSRNWGALVDLIAYEGTSRGKGRVKLLWLIPIWWGDDD